LKICLFNVPGITVGKHNLKDPRLDEADRLVEAKKKTYAQVDLVGPEETLTSDSILVPREQLIELIFLDLEFIETRLGRGPGEAEKAVLEKLKAHLETERTIHEAGLTEADLQAVAAHNFHTNKPVVVAEPGELDNPEALVLKAFAGSGGLCFLTVGGKENRAWPIRRGTTAWEAAGSIHTDIQKGFIRAEVTSYGDFIAAGGETQAKRAGKQRLELKNYVVQDYDLVNFRFNK
jgi:ribosome-binding ATPase YchF (GTP1/OBG family)